jgi:glutathione S-transferase
MPLKLYFHPLSSFCQKVLIALYENDTAFEPQVVDLLDPAQDAAFKAMWPIGRFPLLRDEARDRLIPESSIIIEYLDQHHPGRTRFLPAEPERARETRMRDRFFDLYVNTPVQKIVTDKLRPAGMNDPFGVEQAKAQVRTAYDLIERDLDGKTGVKTWAMGDTFTMADCAAAPALFYADKVLPFSATHKNTAAYFQRLMERASYARALKEAQPYFAMFPG